MIGDYETPPPASHPDYYNSLMECKNAKPEVQTNPRYSAFTQSIFTAGDEEQFQKYRNKSNGELCPKKIDLSSNIFSNFSLQEDKLDWEKYHNLTTESVDNTFNYIFHKLKKGIFVKIQDNKLLTFLPFSKVNYRNEWGDRIKYDPSKFKSMYNFIEYTNSLAGYRTYPNSINLDTSEWYGNNCLIRFDFNEGDTNQSNLRDMFNELCKTRKIPDIEFFVNRRDFPLLKNNETEPYNNFFDSDSFPLLSHNYPTYSPILGMCSSDSFADIPIPTYEDWARVSNVEDNKFFEGCKEYNYKFNLNFSSKKPTAVFRGSTTGCGITIETNPRLKVSQLSKNTKPDEDGYPLLDAGITKWNLRPKKVSGNKYLGTIDIKNLGFGLVNKLSPVEQSNYKYLINVDGNVSAFRLSLEMRMGSVILLADSPWKIWYRDMLEPYVHYIPIKDDLSDLIEKVRWCKKNEEKCKEIVENCLSFYDQFLEKKGVLDYLQDLLVRLKIANGSYYYNFYSPNDFQLDKEKKLLEEIQYACPIAPDSVTLKSPDLPFNTRWVCLYKAIGWFIYLSILGKTFHTFIKKKGKLVNTRTTEVYDYTISEKDLMICKKSKKEKELIHDAFVGLSCINPILSMIPNFVYTYCLYPPEGLIQEKIRGVTLENFIKSKVKLVDYISILKQVSLALHVAQRECALIHGDLLPWNIIIQKIENKFPFDYTISDGKVISINTSLIPIIIDYGKACVIYNKEVYGWSRFSNICDIYSLIVSSLHLVLTHQTLSQDEFQDVLFISNFLTGGTFRKEKFINLSELKSFLNISKKYSNIISVDKCELESKTPLDFFNYLNKLNSSLEFSVKSSIVNSQQRVNSRQIFEFMISNTKEDKIKSYENFFIKFNQASLPVVNSPIFCYYLAQTFYKELLDTYTSGRKYIEKVGGNNVGFNLNRLKGYFESSSKIIELYYKDKIIKPPSLSFDEYSYPKELISVDYSPKTFESIEQMENFYTSNSTSLEDFSASTIGATVDYYSYITNSSLLVSTLLTSGTYEVKDKEKFRKYFKDILSINPFYSLVKFGQEYTFRELSRDVVSNDLKVILNKLEENKLDSCKDLNNYILKCKELLMII